MTTLRQRHLPPWMPPEGTVTAVEAGYHWNALVLPQGLGLAVLEHLDRASSHRPGPVAWDSSGRSPRLYFLTPTNAAGQWPVGRVLSRGTHIALPGATSITPPNPCWIAPPDPDEPDRLVPARELRESVSQSLAAGWVEYRSSTGAVHSLIASADQLRGRACILCGRDGGPFLTAGHVYTEASGPLCWPVVTCDTKCVEVAW